LKLNILLILDIPLDSFRRYTTDVNGSLNIMRKYLKDKCIPEIIKQIRDNGVVDSPSRLRVS
jgi:hypothetical protein